MSSTKKVVIIFSGIFLASVMGIAVTLGIFFGSAGGFKNFSDIKNLGDMFQGHMQKVNESGSLDLKGVNAVKIEATSSDIHIIPSDTAEVELKGDIISLNQRENYLNVTERDGTLTIRVKDGNWPLFNFLSVFTDLDLTVYLPAGSMLDASVHCTSGSIDMEGMRLGDVEMRRTSGDLTVRDCTAESFVNNLTSGNTKIESSSLGSVRSTCHSGDTSISGTSGSLYVHSTSGKIDIAGASGAIDAECTSGEISIDVKGAMQPIAASLTSGSVRIYISKDAAFDLEAKTTSGGFSSDFDIAISGSLSKNFTGEDISGTVNGGGPLVSVTVTSGNINLIEK